MGYLSDYKARSKDCNNCEHKGYVSGPCHECYGFHFKDRIDLLTYIKQRVREDAIVKFDESDEGKTLKYVVEQTEEMYSKAKDEYTVARDKFIKSELKRIEDKLEDAI